MNKYFILALISLGVSSVQIGAMDNLIENKEETAPKDKQLLKESAKKLKNEFNALHKEVNAPRKDAKEINKNSKKIKKLINNIKKETLDVEEYIDEVTKLSENILEKIDKGHEGLNNFAKNKIIPVDVFKEIVKKKQDEFNKEIKTLKENKKKALSDFEKAAQALEETKSEIIIQSANEIIENNKRLDLILIKKEDDIQKLKQNYNNIMGDLEKINTELNEKNTILNEKIIEEEGKNDALLEKQHRLGQQLDLVKENLNSKIEEINNSNQQINLMTTALNEAKEEISNENENNIKIAQQLKEANKKLEIFIKNFSIIDEAEKQKTKAMNKLRGLCRKGEDCSKDKNYMSPMILSKSSSTEGKSDSGAENKEQKN